MRFLRLLAVTALVLGLSACAHSKFRSYNGPTVTLIQVDKSERKMYLFHDQDLLKTYDIALGFAPAGHKEFEGDGKTPEGAYYISSKNPDSTYHLSLRISYPNAADRAHAKAAGKEPGGDIFIHGGPVRPTSRADWTWGCISVSDREIEQVYAMVRRGTPIRILP